MNSNTCLPWFLGLMLGVFILGILFFDWALSTDHQEQTSFSVIRTERIAEKDGGRYLVYTNKGVYEDTDSLWKWKFNSSDVYNQLQKGKDHTCLTMGFRIPVLSMYRNIVSCSK